MVLNHLQSFQIEPFDLSIKDFLIIDFFIIAIIKLLFSNFGPKILFSHGMTFEKLKLQIIPVNWGEKRDLKFQTNLNLVFKRRPFHFHDLYEISC